MRITRKYYWELLGMKVIPCLISVRKNLVIYMIQRGKQLVHSLTWFLCFPSFFYHSINNAEDISRFLEKSQCIYIPKTLSVLHACLYGFYKNKNLQYDYFGLLTTLLFQGNKNIKISS